MRQFISKILEKQRNIKNITNIATRQRSIII